MTLHRQAAFDALGLTVLQRDWLSSNHVVFGAVGPTPSAVVDTGYGRHSAMTLALVEHALAGQALDRIVNTHLHSDHCGGNRALQDRYPQVRTFVPAASYAVAHAWDESRLSYRPTDQRCERFQVDAPVEPGGVLALGPAEWQVLAAPGHDADALMLFEPQTRVLIAGDALWEDRLAIIFPELDEQPGFLPARQTLALIESLAPRWVIPGHGAAFDDLPGALAASRRRLDAFERDPDKHRRHAARALLMFHMMDRERVDRLTLEAWLLCTPIFVQMARHARQPGGAAAWAAGLIDSLLDDNLLTEHDKALRYRREP